MPLPPIGPALRRATPAFLGAVAFAAAALCGVVFVHVKARVPYGDLTRDPTIILHGQLTSGMLSTFGGLVWAAGLGMCLLAAAAGRREDRGYFLWTAAFTGWLLGDDVFLFHEKLFPVYLGVEEKVFHAAYPLFALTWLVAFRRRLLRSAWPLCCAAFGFLALSQAMDLMLPGEDRDLHFLFEDGAKFVGIVLWTTFHLVAGRDALRAAAPEGDGRG